MHRVHSSYHDHDEKEGHKLERCLRYLNWDYPTHNIKRSSTHKEGKHIHDVVSLNHGAYFPLSKQQHDGCGRVGRWSRRTVNGGGTGWTEGMKSVAMVDWPVEADDDRQRAEEKMKICK